MRKILLIIILLSLLMLPCAAISANIVTNGDFETGYFTGWTVNYASFGSFAGVDGGNPHWGNDSAFFGAMDSLDDSISQTLSTISGQSYVISFWLDNDGTSDDHFSAYWNGAPLLDLTNATLFAYTQYTFNRVASASTTLLQFNSYDIQSFYTLDDVSVTETQGVPEPATMLLLGLGLFGLAGVRRKFKK